MRWLLHLYPTGFRREYGGAIAAEYRRRRAQADGIGLISLWIDTILDTVGNALLVHWDLLRQDLRQGIRHLLRTPLFAITAIGVIAIGIGANTAAFSLADIVFLRPLPFPTAGRLVTIWEREPSYSMTQPSPANYRDWRDMSHAFDAMGAYHTLSASLLGGGSPQQIAGIAVHGPLLDLFGVAPLIGHLPSASEVAQGAPVIVLSYSLWQDDFGSDRNVVGRAVTLEGAPYTVAGVMPRAFAFPDRSVRFWAPMQAAEAHDTERANSWFYVVARLKPGVTVPQARQEMNRVSTQLEHLYPQTDSGVTVMSLRDTYGVATEQRGGPLLLALCGAALCVLLISCANLASLLLVRAMMRRRELAVRAALGAGRDRLVRQLLTESLLLALAGGVAGVGLAFAAMPLLGQLVPSTLPLAQSSSIDVRVLAVAALLTVLTGVGFGVLPAIRAGGGSSFDGLRDGARGGGGRRARLRSILVMAEVAASVVLLVAAGLLLHALSRVRAVDPGFRQDQVMTFHTELPLYRYWRVSERAAFYRQVLDRIRATPGVQAAGYISSLPMKWGGGIWTVGIVPDTGFRHASLRFVTPGYFGAMRIQLQNGRTVADGDTRAAPFVAVVSASFAERFWPGRSPIGQHFNFAFADRTVVGVVHDVRVRGPERESEPQVYLPFQQVGDSSLISYAPADLAVRSTLPPTALVPLVRRIVRDADPLQAISDVASLQDVVDQQTVSRAVQVRVLAAFALVAVLLAGIGLYGLLAFAVSQRRQEMAIRMALGARSGQIVRMILGYGGALALGGVIPGALIGYAAGRGMNSLLAGVDAFDIPSFAAAMLLCAVMVLVGSLVPAWRATRVAPGSVMRAE
ncbi:MAG TPA: ABC transporter permease [Gemmatimonadales bacterium]|jgi:putative ABC transport system permease protein